MVEDDRLIGSAEAAQMLGVHRATLLRWVARGKLAAADKLPGQNGDYRFRFAAVAQLADARKERV